MGNMKFLLSDLEIFPVLFIIYPSKMIFFLVPVLTKWRLQVYMKELEWWWGMSEKKNIDNIPK